MNINPSYIGCMDKTQLQALLGQFGIHSANDLKIACGYSRAHAWAIYNGIDKIGKTTALKIHAATQCPLDRLLKG